jgi:predicted ABC-type ATPase
VRCLLIVAGPNGAGKTTLVQQGVLGSLLHAPPVGSGVSINPDDVARELTGGHPPSPEDSLRAAQLCDAKLDAEIAAGRSVTVETVLSSDKLKGRVEADKAAGFSVILVYVTLHSAALNVARVEQRRAQGGHDVPPDRVLNRRTRSHALFEWFARRADIVLVFDNSTMPVYAAGKADGIWDLPDVDRLPADLAATIRRLAR